MLLNGKTYSFSGVINGITSYIERSLGLAALFSTVTASVRIDTMVREQFKLVLNVPAPADSGCCTTDPVLGFCEANIQVRMSPNLDAAVRADFLQRIQDLVETSEFTEAITNLVSATS